MSLNSHEISVVILAGGKSRRLGADKSLLVLDGQPLIVRSVRMLETLTDDLVVVTNEPVRYSPLGLPVRYVPDEKRGMGSLMGIYSGLKAASYAHALVVGCDMPFLNLALLRFMMPMSDGFDVVIPRLHGLLEPLHAIYSKACIPHMSKLLWGGGRKITAFFPEVRVCHVEEGEIEQFDPQRLSFINVNTREDWERVQNLQG